MGDREFTDYLNRKVNLRRVAYLGSGQLDIPEEKHLVYGKECTHVNVDVLGWVSFPTLFWGGDCMPF